jgi:hypothetical protein
MNPNTAMDAQMVVQRQMEAYNRRDVDEFCSYFAPDAVTRLYENDEVLAEGMPAIHALYAKRFAENPNLHLTVEARMVLDNVVIDREFISGFDGGQTIEAVAIFEIHNGRIQRASFVRRAAR